MSEGRRSCPICQEPTEDRVCTEHGVPTQPIEESSREQGPSTPGVGLQGYELATRQGEAPEPFHIQAAPRPESAVVVTETRPERPASTYEEPPLISTEIRAGFTTFLTMAYILFVNPDILGKAIIIPEVNLGAQLLTATALAAAIGCILMGTLARYPFALAPGMGLNAYFAFTVVGEREVPWETALGAVFLSGIAFLILSVTGVRTLVVNAIPNALKMGVAGGIGLFLGAVALKTSGLAGAGGEGQTLQGATVLVGLALTGAMMWLRVPGALLWGIILATLFSAVVDSPVATIPEFFTNRWVAPPVWPTDLWGKLDVAAALELGVVGIVFVFLFVDFFDTAGTLVGLSSRAGFVEEDGNLPRANEAFSADAIATSIGAWLGTSTTTSYIESASGITEGGRTGVTAVVVGALFALSTIFWPLANMIPPQATAPALFLVGGSMALTVRNISWGELRTALPVALTMVAMPVFFSITDGISVGIASWTLIHLVSGRGRDVHPLMMGLTALLVARYGWLWTTGAVGG